MDVKYIGGDVPWTLPFGDHFYSPSQASLTSSHIDPNDLETIARRHEFEPLYSTSEVQSHKKTGILDENLRWMNAGVVFTDKTIGTTTPQTDFHDDHGHTFCYLCSINQHDHERTKPRDPSARRKLIPYNNPKAVKARSSSFDQNVSDSSASHFIPYRFIVRTDSRENSGTRAQVYLYMSGTESNWTSIHLRGRTSSASTDGFPSGSIRTFCLKGPDIGHLHHLNVNLVGARSEREWFLKEIEITNLNTSITWLCEFNCWLPKQNAQEHREVKPIIDRQPQIKANIDRKPEISLENLSVYILEVQTGGKTFAGTDSTIQVIVRGSKSQTRRLTLTSDQADLFEKNQLDTFAIVGWDLGELLELTLESDKAQMAADWDVKEITMRKIQPNEEYKQSQVYFPFNTWLGKQVSTLKAKRDVYSSVDHRLKGPICYHISVKTGKALGAGTDANVYLQIYGNSARTTIHQLDNQAKNDFEQGTTSEFTIMDIDVGMIDRIKIWHDDSGIGAAWFLDSVIIRKKYSNSRLIADTFVQRLEQISRAYYHQAREQIKKNWAKTQNSPRKDNASRSGDRLNVKSKDYDDQDVIDRHGSSRTNLRKPIGHEKGNLQKKVTFDKTSFDSSDDIMSRGSQRTDPIRNRAKQDTLPIESGHFDHQAYWISTHNYAEKKWLIKSIEESDKDLLDQPTRLSLLSDRLSAKNKMKISADEKEDDVYEFEAHRWLDKNKGDHKLEVILTPKSNRLSSQTANQLKSDSIDSKKKPLPSPSGSYSNARIDKPDEFTTKRSSPRDIGPIGRSSPRDIGPIDRSPRTLASLDRSPRVDIHSSELSMDKYNRSSPRPFPKSPSSILINNERDLPNPPRSSTMSLSDTHRSKPLRTQNESASPLTSHRDVSSRMSSEIPFTPRSAGRFTPEPPPRPTTRGQTYSSAYGIAPLDDS